MLTKREGFMAGTLAEMDSFIHRYLDPGCFEKDQYGFDIVDLDQNTPLEDGLRSTHRAIAFFLSSGGILLNLLLLYFLACHSQMLGEMRPMLAFNVIVDLIDSICYFLLMPFVFTCYGYHITFGNGWFSTHTVFGNALLTGITASVLISTWQDLNYLLLIAIIVFRGFVPIQFLYRMSLVKEGGRPEGWRWFIYITGTILGAVLATITATNCYITTPPAYVNNSLKVLRHSGFAPDADFVHGGVSTDSRVIIYHIFFMIMAAISYSLIIYAAVVIQKFLKLLAPRMSSATRRMHKEMTRVLFALAVGPLVNHFLPAFHTSFSMMSCHNAAFSSMISSCFLVLTPFLNPIFTLVFIRPYRRVIMGWFLRLVGKKVLPATSVHSTNQNGQDSKNETNTIAMIA